MTGPVSPEELRRVLKKAVTDGMFSIPELAADIGMPVRTLRAYVYGQRTPAPETVQRIAHAFAERGKTIIMLAGELERLARPKE